MIALTQKKREELIADCKKSISDAEGYIQCHGEDKGIYSLLIRSKIALEALNSNPEMYVNCIERCDSYGSEIERRAYPDLLSAMKSIDDHGGVVLELFTSPPVPEIKFPPFMHVKEFEQPVARQIIVELRAVTWAACIAETKRINGLGE